MAHYVGIDFGTTNSVLSVCNAHGQVRTAQFPVGSQIVDTFRTALCFWQEGTTRHIAAGPYAIEEYLNDTEESRFIQSIKTYLASTTFTDTRIQGVRYTLEDLIAVFLKKMWTAAQPHLELPLPRDIAIISGRPVEFAGQNPDNARAEKRLHQAYTQAGFTNVSFAFEPQGAAYHFAQHLKQDARVLVADFGGGTSDFSVVNCAYQNNTLTLTPIAHGGVGVAGDILDYRIIDQVISPALGKNSRYESFGKWLDMPISYYKSFASWHVLSMIKTPKILREIEEIARSSDAPERVMALHTMIDRELGYMLYRAVSQAKAALSAQDQVDFVFHAPDLHIQKTIRRRDFETWIEPDMNRISDCIDDVMTKSKLTLSDIDRVFMTGGTSFVPAIRKLITDRFGTEKIAAGGEFTSVSAGLALMAYHQRAV